MSENTNRLRGHLVALTPNERDRKLIAELLSDVENDFDNMANLLRRTHMALAETEALELQHGAVIERLMAENAALQATIERCWKLAYRWHRESQRLPYYARMGELYADQLAAAINGGEKSGDE